MSKTQTAPLNDPGMWKRLLARAHPDSGGSDELFVWARELQSSMLDANYQRPIGIYGEPYDSILAKLKGHKDKRDTREPKASQLFLLAQKAGLSATQAQTFQRILKDEKITRSQVGFLLGMYMDRR